MLSAVFRHSLRRTTVSTERSVLASLSSGMTTREKSSSLESYTENPIGGEGGTETGANDGCHPYVFPFDENGDAKNETSEVISFPAVDRDSPTYNSETMPVLLNSKEHAIGYLSKILNARVYEACIETDLQRAKNLSALSIQRYFV